MENCGYIIGYDLNENGCQISYYDEEKHELKTLEVAADNYQIPLMVGHYKEAWMFGREAQRAAMMDKGWVVSDLYRKAQRNERIEKDGTVYEARWLLRKFIDASDIPQKGSDFCLIYSAVDRSGDPNLFKRSWRTGRS